MPGALGTASLHAEFQASGKLQQSAYDLHTNARALRTNQEAHTRTEKKKGRRGGRNSEEGREGRDRGKTSFFLAPTAAFVLRSL